jgi:hypothetical protein
MMKSIRSGRPDIHRRPFSDGFETLQDLN